MNERDETSGSGYDQTAEGPKLPGWLRNNPGLKRERDSERKKVRIRSSVRRRNRRRFKPA